MMNSNANRRDARLCDSTREDCLPDGWVVKKLGECFKLSSGENITSKMMIVDGIYPVYGGNGIAGMYDKFNLSGSNVIIGRVGALCGNVRHINESIWLTDNGFKISDCKYEFDHAFLAYLLNFKNLRNYARQAAQPVISNSSLENVILQFPKSLPEQKRIVAILDVAFTAIARAKENAQKNLANARELFESYLQGVFANPGDDWEEKSLGEIGETQTGTTPKTIDKENYGNYIPFITPADIDICGDGVIRYRDEGLSEQGLKNGRKMEEGSILMVCIGASIGKVGFIDRAVSCNQQINSLTVGKDFCSKFFYYALSTKNFFEQVIQNSAQATLPIINKGKWEKLSVCYPIAKKEQEAIVGKLEVLSAETKRLESIYRKKLEDLDELKKSILDKAFKGML